MKTAAPIAKAQRTESGKTPSGASLETPINVSSHGKLEATQVPIPIIKVWTTKP